MSNIRKEYSEYKQFKKQIYMEAAEAWTEENVILINERLNRNSIYRLNSAIQRFDNKFGPYRHKLPTISKILNDAENGLHLVVTGKIGARSAAHMLQRMSIIYNILTDFFGNDLKSLLKTPTFRVAISNPETRMDEIQDVEHDIKQIRRSLASALKPNDEERIIFRKAYKSFDMPTLDWNMAAKELCCLSCKELQELSGVQKSPIVVIDDDHFNTGLEEAGAVTTAVGGAIGTGVAAAGQKLGGFFKTFQQHGEQMGKALGALEKIIYSIPEFSALKTPITNLRTKAQKASATKSGVPSFDPSAGIRGFFMHPTVVVWKQSIMVLESFDAILKAWDATIAGNYEESGFTKQNLPNLRKTLTNSVKGDFLSRMFRMLSGGVRSFPGLSPNDIVNAFMKVAESGVGAGGEEKKEETEGKQQAGGEQEGREKNQPVKENVGYINSHYNILLLKSSIRNIMLNEDYQDFKALIDKLRKFEMSGLGKVEDVVTKDLGKASKEFAAAGAGGQQGQEQKQQEPEEPGEIPDNAEEEAAQLPDVTEENIKSALAGLDRVKKNDLEQETIQEVNDLIKNANLPGVQDVNSLEKMINTYQAILVKDQEINKLIDALETAKEYGEQLKTQQASAGAAPQAGAQAAPAAPGAPATPAATPSPAQSAPQTTTPAVTPPGAAEEKKG